MTGQKEANVHDNGICFLELLTFLARRWKLIVLITIAATVFSATVAAYLPSTYASNSKLLFLQYVDDTKVLRVAANGQLVLEKKEGHWQPADTSILQSVFESSALRQAVGNKLGVGGFTLHVTQQKLPGVLSLRVEGEKQESTAKIASATVEEAGRLAFQFGILPSPILFLGEKPGKFEGTPLGVSVLEPPNPGVKVKPYRGLIVLLSAAVGFICSICLAIVLEYFRSMNDADRARLGEIKTAIRGNCR